MPLPMNVGIQDGSLRFSRRVADLETEAGVGVSPWGDSLPLLSMWIRQVSERVVEDALDGTFRGWSTAGRGTGG